MLSLLAISLSKYSRCGIKPCFAELQITFVICPSVFFLVVFANTDDSKVDCHGSSKPGNRSFGRFSRPLLEVYFLGCIQLYLKVKSLAVAEIFRYCKGFRLSYSYFCILDQKYKRGLSSSIFDEIANGECQTILFEDAFKLLQNNTFSRDDLSFDVGNVRNIHYGDVLIKYGTTVNVSEIEIPCIKPDRNIGKFSAASYLRNGDIVFADTAEDYAVGKATEIVGVINQKVLSGLHTIPCRPHDGFAPMYLGYYFNSHHFRSQIYRMIQGIKVSSISKSEIVKTTILVPSYAVQEKVALLLSKADHLIEREEKTVDALQKMRRGLLQQLFI